MSYGFHRFISCVGVLVCLQSFATAAQFAQGWTQIGTDAANALVNASDVATPGVHVCPDHPYDKSIYGSAFIAAEGCQAVTQAYSGGALDTDTNQLIVWGGGHADYGGNEIYLLNFLSNPPTWHRAFGPTLPGGGVSTNNPSGCVSGLSGSSSYPALPGCVGGGNAPTSTHSVGGLTYIPLHGDASGTNPAEFFDFGGSRNSGSGGGDNRGWLYDLTNQPTTWTDLGILALANVDNLSNIAEWDPMDKVIYLISTAGFGVYNPSATTTAIRSGSCGTKCSIAPRSLVAVGSVIGSTSENGAIDQAHRLMVIVWKNGTDLQGFNIDEVDLETGSTLFSGGTNRTTQLPGCPTNIGSATTGDTIYAPSVTYDPTINGGSIVIHNYPLDSNIYVWNHASHSCTSENYGSNSAESPANVTASKERGAVYGRFRYVPAMGYYIYQSEGDLAPFVLCRNAIGCGGPGTSVSVAPAEPVGLRLQ